MKTNELIEVHKEINGFLEKNFDSIFDFYTPENWFPIYRYTS